MKLMKTMRSMLERNKNKFLVGLVIFLLVIFTVASEFTDALRGGAGGDGARSGDIVGSFALLPLQKKEVTRAEFENARGNYRLISQLQGASGDRIRDSEIWTYLVLQEAAKAQGIRVSDAEVRDMLKRLVPDFIYNDVQQYKEWIRLRFGRTARDFEESLRSMMTLQRVRDIYRESFMIAPPATREEMVKKYASQNIEYARVHYAALDAEAFLDAADKELAAEKDAEAKLKAFYEKDPAVLAERSSFRNPRRYGVEFLYTLHKTVTTEKEYDRVEALFSRAYPELDVGKLEAKVADMRDYFGIYRDRLLAQAGTTWADVQKQVAKDEPTKDEGEPEKKDEGEKKEDGEPEKKEGEPEKADDPDKEPDPATKAAWFSKGFEICREQVMRELKVRGMYQWFRDQVDKDKGKSLKELFEKLKAVDDKENPLCSEEMGKGIIVFVSYAEKPLSGDEIEDLEDRGVRFTHNVRIRVNKIGDTDLPQLYQKADPMGEEGHGRMIIRLQSVKAQARKTYDELEPREKEDLRTEFYLPARARDKAKAALGELREQCVEGKVEPADFRKEAEKLGARFFEDEWITASYDFLAEPEKQVYWRSEYLHMRDRHFLRQRLASVLGRDRIKQELKAGSYLAVETDSRSDADDPGAAYLVVLLERRKPGVDTMPPTEFDRFLGTARSRRISEDNERWSVPTIQKMDQLFADFEVEFYGDMKDRMDDERKRRQRAEKRKTPR